MKVLLVDDNKIFLSGLKNLLEDNGYEIVGTATGGGEALSQVQKLQPELVLMDILMPGQDGIATTRILKEKNPLLKIVMLTISENDEDLFDAISAGASGYLIKGERPELFLDALAGLARGEAPLSPGLAARIMAEFARRERSAEQSELAEQPEAPSPASLSDRQKEILSLVSQGKTYKDIADRMSLSERTIKYHMGTITNRLHLENRTQVILYAAKVNY